MEIGFQEFFVGLRHSVDVKNVRFDGIEVAQPAPGVIEAIEAAEVVVICPSNPIVSIGPVLAVPRGSRRRGPPARRCRGRFPDHRRQGVEGAGGPDARKPRP